MVTLNSSKGGNTKLVVSARKLQWVLLGILTILVFLLILGHKRINNDIRETSHDEANAIRRSVPDTRETSPPDTGASTSSAGAQSSLSPPYKYDTSSFLSKSRTPLLPCDPPPPNGTAPNGFLSQSSARSVLKKFVDRRTAENGKPRFVPSLNELMDEARRQNKSLVTVQLGGMDGKTGDPMYRMTEFNKDISNWMPVVMEPVPENFDKLVAIYKGHMDRPDDSAGKHVGLTCPHVLHQLANYDASRQNPPNSGMCDFCHFDHTKEECKDMPNWLKYETGSMECETKSKQECFVADSFICTTIKDALDLVGLHPRDVVALQIDVEGFENFMLRGYFGEISSEEYPPIINFESKVLKGRGQYDELEDYLRQLGYGIHPKRVDSLAIFGAQGL